MAQDFQKYTQNVSGAFSVNELCVACNACVEDAPLFFSMNDQDEHAYVSLQPTKANEITLCEEALEICPVGAIESSSSSNHRR
jgi:ferredoxin